MERSGDFRAFDAPRWQKSPASDGLRSSCQAVIDVSACFWQAERTSSTTLRRGEWWLTSGKDLRRRSVESRRRIRRLLAAEAKLGEMITRASDRAFPPCQIGLRLCFKHDGRLGRARESVALSTLSGSDEKLHAQKFQVKLHETSCETSCETSETS